MKGLKEKFDIKLIRTVAKLHDQFGHPSPRGLCKEMRARKMPKEWISLAEVYVCSFCFMAKKPALVRIDF